MDNYDPKIHGALIRDRHLYFMAVQAHNAMITWQYSKDKFARFRAEFPTHPDPNLWPAGMPINGLPIPGLYHQKCGIVDCKVCHRIMKTKL